MPAAIPVTITTASNTNTSTYTEIPLPSGGDVSSANNAVGAQVLRITGSINNSAGTAANLRFVLRDGSRVYKYVDVGVTVTAVRTGIDGSSGDYVLSVSGTNSDFIDLTGYDYSQNIKWYVGLAGAFGGSATSMTLYLFPIRAI